MIVSRQMNHSESTEATACRCHERAPGSERSAAQAELSMLAHELAKAFGEQVESYRKYCDLSSQEARKLTAENSPERIDHILNAPPDEVNWSDLGALAGKDPVLAVQRWENIKEAARNEIRSGYRAARSVEDGGGPLERARFLAVRAELMEAWRPRNTTEQQLVDQLARWQILLWRWQEAFSTWTNCSTIATRQAKKGQSYETMRVWESEALEGAARKVELLHRLYLRTLKALQDLRQPRLPVSVRHADMVNVGPIRISMDNLSLPNGSSEQMNQAEIKAR
jgi:hypothetical protein